MISKDKPSPWTRRPETHSDTFAAMIFEEKRLEIPKRSVLTNSLMARESDTLVATLLGRDGTRR
jgi:hypothetical protein